MSEGGRFAEYEADIRREYQWVEESAYRAARSRILRGFLDRPRIYRTEILHDRLESRARENLAGAIAGLSG